MNALELFAGGGGAALGLRSAGLRHVGLVERDPDACATLRAAGLEPVIYADLRRLNWRDRAARTWARVGSGFRVPPGLRHHRGRARLLWGSFPCQVFSQAGSRACAADIDRNGWPWMVDAIDTVQPTWVLGENVAGLTHHSGRFHGAPTRCPGCYLHQVILADLAERFAHVGHYVVDAADYGVPQNRLRVIVWAGPVPLPCPAPTHARPGDVRQGGLFGPRLRPWRTIGEALGIGPDYRVVGKGRNPQTSGAPRTFRDITGEPGPCITAEQIGNRGPWILPVASFEGRTDSTPGGLPSATEAHPLTVRQAATLQDFPTDHPWQGTTRTRFRQVGNAVPPTIARVFGTAVMEADPPSPAQQCTRSGGTQ